MICEPVFQVSVANSLIVDEYLKDAKSPEDIRDSFTEVIGDLLMTLPVLSVAGYHTGQRVPKNDRGLTTCPFTSAHSSYLFLLALDVGASVYMYEFAYSSDIHRGNRPSFVKADHADDVGFMFGACFWNGTIRIVGWYTSCTMHLIELPRWKFYG